jgi:hypothetical protein
MSLDEYGTQLQRDSETEEQLWYNAAKLLLNINRPATEVN